MRDKPRDDFKRPDHPDFMDSNELRKAEFSGYRMNNLTNCAEIWLLGNLESSVSPQDLALNPRKIQEEMERVFALEKALPDTPDGRAYGKMIREEEDRPLILLPQSKLRS